MRNTPRRRASQTTSTKKRVAQPTRRETVLHSNLILLEVSDPLLLEELRADRRFAPLLLAPLADCVAVVKPGASDGLLRALLRAGHTPKVVQP